MITIGSASRLQCLHRLHDLTNPLRRGNFAMQRKPKTLMRAYYFALSGIRPHSRASSDFPKLPARLVSRCARDGLDAIGQSWSKTFY